MCNDKTNWFFWVQLYAKKDGLKMWLLFENKNREHLFKCCGSTWKRPGKKLQISLFVGLQICKRVATLLLFHKNRSRLTRAAVFNAFTEYIQMIVV